MTYLMPGLSVKSIINPSILRPIIDHGGSPYSKAINKSSSISSYSKTRILKEGSSIYLMRRIYLHVAFEVIV